MHLPLDTEQIAPFTWTLAISNKHSCEVSGSDSGGSASESGCIRRCGQWKKTFFGHALTVWNVAAQCCSISDQRGTPRRRRRSRRSPAIVADNPSHHLISTACSQIKTLRCMRCLIELKPCDETQQWGYEICKIVAATAGKYCFRSNKWTNDICICIHLVSFE